MRDSGAGGNEKGMPRPVVYVDFLFGMVSRVPWAREAGEAHGHRWCHLWCDPGNEEELHALAGRIGMKREWFQDREGFPHYDLLPTQRQDAIREGAVEIRLRDWVREKRPRKTR